MTVVGRGVRQANTGILNLFACRPMVGWLLACSIGFTAVSHGQEGSAPLRPNSSSMPEASTSADGSVQPDTAMSPDPSFPADPAAQSASGAPQTSPQSPPAAASASTPQNGIEATPGVRAFAGMKVVDVQFKGVDPGLLQPLPSQLELQPGDTLDIVKVRESLRRLYATGLYQTIDVNGIRTADGITIVFSGRPRLFLGRTDVAGVKNERLNTQLLASTKLNPGTPYSAAKVTRSESLLEQTLEENGFYQGAITRTEQEDPANSQVNIFYQIHPGLSARVGDVKVDGTPGMPLEEFREAGKLKANSKVDRNTVNRALSRLRKRYDKKQHWAGNVTLESSQYQKPENHLNYAFNAKQGPVVKVEVQGTSISKSQIRRLVPIYEEGAVDLDLINEGAHNIRDYLQSKGYFDATVTHQPVHRGTTETTALYIVVPGLEHRIDSVKVRGNKYFDTDTIEEHISVKTANFVERHGTYSQGLVNADVSNITALYQGNGFSHAKVTADVKDLETDGATKKKVAGLVPQKPVAHLAITYIIDEGQQQHIGSYTINGANKVPVSAFQPLLNTQVGQPYSSVNVTGDRDEILSYYLSQGYSTAQVNVVQQTDPKDPGLVDVKMNIAEGDQVYVNKVLVSGLHYTRPTVVEQRISIQPGQPLDQSALLDTQRRLYNLALFNEVNTAVQNPNGDQLRKNVLLQITEAKRWDVTYGFGFQAQTGTPYHNTPTATQLFQLGLNPSTFNGSTNGHFGLSPDVLFDISRINLRGTNQSLTLRTAYGNLEQQALVTYLDPGLFRNPKFDLALAGGYTSSQNVTTYTASSLGANARVTEHATKPTTLIYSFAYREVKVNPNSIQVSAALIPLLSQPARIGGPGLTFIRDTRDDPLDAHRGTFNTAATFFSDSHFGSQANFGRLDASNSTYYTFGKRLWVFARESRYAQERSFGTPRQELVPLPERLYGGGATSHRGFGINAAGPRDPQTGFPIGGAAAFINSFELRTPYPNLPYVGNNLGFVLFHDMGNVFNRSGDVWRSFANFHQPNEKACRTVPLVSTDTNGKYIINETSNGVCSFNYFSHALGLGVRYRTPIGPIRVDTSYNLNPPYYPIVFNYESSTSNTPAPQTGQASHFNFFFSIGQTF